MRKAIIGILTLGSVALCGSVVSAEEMWKDGMMFTQEELTTLEGHKAVKIVFGLQPGKCAGEFTAPDEWLKMTKGAIVFSYPGKDDVMRSAGDRWTATAGTKVTLCNKGDQDAVLTGVQFHPE